VHCNDVTFHEKQASVTVLYERTGVCKFYGTDAALSVSTALVQVLTQSGNIAGST